MNNTKTKLLEAEAKALDLYYETEKRNWIVPGISEDDLSKKIHELAFEMFQAKQGQFLTLRSLTKSI